MNTTLKEIIYNLKNLRQAGRQSQDTLVQDSQYAFIIDQYRSILAARQYEDKKVLSPVFEQTIIAPLTRVKDMETDIFGDKRVYKTTIPSVVSTNYRPLYSAVRTSMFATSIDRSTTVTIRHDLNSPTTRHLVRYFPEGQDLFIVTPEPMQKVFVTAIFDHPLEVEKYKFDHNQPNKFDIYDPYNFEYPMSVKMLDILYKAMTDGEIKLSLITANDTSADSDEESPRPLPSTKQQAQPKTTQDEN